MSKTVVFDELSRIKAIIFDELMGLEQVRDDRRALLEDLLVRAGGVSLGEVSGEDFTNLGICSSLGHLRPLKHPPHRFTCLFCGGMYDLDPRTKNESAFTPPLRQARPSRATNDQLAQEAKDWDEGRLTPEGFRDAPEAIPQNKKEPVGED